MPTPLRVLILEDSPTDSEVMLDHLREAGYAPDWRRVETEADYLAHLEPSLDLILVDFTLPDFDGRRALQLLQDRGWDTPAIVVTGTVSEETAIECLRLGAADYLMKDRLMRLGEAVRSALGGRSLRRERAAAEAASRHKSEFLANMSHELRTPLNSILGFSQLLLEQTADVLSERQIRFLKNIHSSGEHLLQLINGILDLSKAEAGKIVIQPKAMLVAETLEDILVIARGLANKKGQQLETAIAPDLPSLWADPVRFKQILFNLLSNAMKFTPERGTIRVTARRVPAIAESGFRNADWEAVAEAGHSAIRNPQSEFGDFLEIAVRDTGIGIKAEDLPRLFQEFVQLEAAATKYYEGTGLGLALTKRLVELHGGQIRAASPGEGLGSTFTVILPFRRTL